MVCCNVWHSRNGHYTIRISQHYPPFPVNSNFINVIQCVVPLCWPKSGLNGIADKTSFTFIWQSDHLKTSVPPTFRTLMHSSKPFEISSFQLSLSSFPYCAFIIEFWPTCFKCGGSKTTKLKVLSSKGISLKSPTTSGTTFTCLPCISKVSCLISIKVVCSSFLSNQNKRLPQQASKILMSVILIPHSTY
ncbi:hypothetical protein Javan471_0042 [Streptococcus phage Javan471]|nr:hypothetical protein Javan471_0042 [Streptococcus phage Javan471]